MTEVLKYAVAYRVDGPHGAVTVQRVGASQEWQVRNDEDVLSREPGLALGEALDVAERLVADGGGR